MLQTYKEFITTTAAIRRAYKSIWHVETSKESSRPKLNKLDLIAKTKSQCYHGTSMLFSFSISVLFLLHCLSMKSNLSNNLTNSAADI